MVRQKERVDWDEKALMVVETAPTTTTTGTEWEGAENNKHQVISQSSDDGGVGRS